MECSGAAPWPVKKKIAVVAALDERGAHFMEELRRGKDTTRNEQSTARYVTTSSINNSNYEAEDALVASAQMSILQRHKFQRRKEEEGGGGMGGGMGGGGGGAGGGLPPAAAATRQVMSNGDAMALLMDVQQKASEKVNPSVRSGHVPDGRGSIRPPVIQRIDSLEDSLKVRAAGSGNVGRGGGMDGTMDNRGSMRNGYLLMESIFEYNEDSMLSSEDEHNKGSRNHQYSVSLNESPSDFPSARSGGGG
eukprot:CAMPEP_0194673674 /NCGR_PEP_ID=MMETSP0295-20121207/7200_1 /TAXON_ID=39354 /ORGANISM="Heterosigma akashiwo, Strain CCMP2393" /LENGTH=248 /DNA_ID=CAMNT_0039557657 /DNA_START=425 /DNA_END=1169 /DNA_ORIENTATION=-